MAEQEYNELLQEYEQKRLELRKLYLKLIQLRGGVKGVKETPEDNQNGGEYR